MNTNPLSQIASAEASLVQALNATSAALDNLGTNSLDQAMARVQASAAGAKDRLAGAAALLGLTVADVVETVTGTAAQIVAALAVNDLQPVRPAALTAPIPTQPAADPIIDLAPPPPPVDDVPAAQPQQDAQQPRQATQASEPTRDSATVEIDGQTQAQTAFVAQALRDLADMPEVSRMICCRHNGIGVPACPACAARAAAFVPPTHEEALELERQVMSATANAPVDPGRDDRARDEAEAAQQE